MTAPPSLNCVAASFVSTYYTNFVTNVRELANLYTAEAFISHLGRKETGKVGVDLVLGNYASSKFPFAASVDIASITVKGAEVDTITTLSYPKTVMMKVTGTFCKGEDCSNNIPFLQEFELREVAPMCYGIASDVLSVDTVGGDYDVPSGVSSFSIIKTGESSGGIVTSGPDGKKTNFASGSHPSYLTSLPQNKLASAADLSAKSTLAPPNSFAAVVKSPSNCPTSAAVVIHFPIALPSIRVMETPKKHFQQKVV